MGLFGGPVEDEPGAEAKNYVLAVFGDTHPGSTVGLVHPGGIRLDDGGLYKPSTVQQAFWERYVEYWRIVRETAREYDARVVGIFLGDGTEDNKHSKHQVATVNRSVLVNASADTFGPALDSCDVLHYLRGTEAHTGGSGELEEVVARRIGAAQDQVTGNFSRWELTVELNGFRGFFAHHPYSNDIRPWTSGGGAQRTAAMLVYDCAEVGDPVPDFAVFGHTHKFGDSGDNHAVRVFFNLPWCATTAHGHRIGYSGRAAPIGGLIFILPAEGEWRYRRIRFVPSRRRQRPWRDGAR